MEKMISYCGLVCSACPALLATKANDDGKRKEVAELWSKQYGFVLKPEDISCDGCLADGRLLGYCGTCEIRKCAREKKFINCADCKDYPCKKLDVILKSASHAKITSDNN